MEQFIALVDNSDSVIGYEEKHLVHSKGLLHRAFSIFVFNRKGELLLQRRASDKYHSSGLWTNTCCSHLPMGSSMDLFIHERLMDEMGIDCDLRFVDSFHYQVDFGDGMCENEIDHIYIGFTDDIPKPNPIEVSECKLCDIEVLTADVKKNPQEYTYWLKNILQNHFDTIKKHLPTC